MSESLDVINKQLVEHQESCEVGWGECPKCQFFEGWQQGFITARTELLNLFEKFKKLNKTYKSKSGDDVGYYRIEISYPLFRKLFEI
jgi:uncharacterized protein (UPF0212 family)